MSRNPNAEDYDINHCDNDSSAPFEFGRRGFSLRKDCKSIDDDLQQ